MKKLVFLSLLILSGGLGFSQLNHTDKIIEVYGFEWFNQMNTNNPDVINLLDKYADHGFVVQELSSDKTTASDPLAAIPLRGKTGETITVLEFMNAYNSGDFNPLKYDFFPGNEMQTFSLEGTNLVIYILSQESILQN